MAYSGSQFMSISALYLNTLNSFKIKWSISLYVQALDTSNVYFLPGMINTSYLNM